MQAWRDRDGAGLRGSFRCQTSVGLRLVAIVFCSLSRSLLCFACSRQSRVYHHRRRFFFPGLLFLSLTLSVFLEPFLSLFLVSRFPLLAFSPPGFFSFFLVSFLLLALPAFNLRLPLPLLLKPPLLLRFLAETFFLLRLFFCLLLLPLFLPLLPLLFQFLLFQGPCCCLLRSFLGFPSNPFLLLGLFLLSFLILSLLRFSRFLRRALFDQRLLLHEFLEELLLPLLGDFFPIRGQYSLFKHPGGKDLEHSSALFHSLLFGHSILKTALSNTTPGKERREDK
jgi:hypothetical protein